MRPSPEQRDLVVGTAYEGQRGPRHYGHYVSGAPTSPCIPRSSPAPSPLSDAMHAGHAAYNALWCGAHPCQRSTFCQMTQVAYWRPLDGRATRLYSAVGLLTAQRLNAVLKVPIGIIQVRLHGRWAGYQRCVRQQFTETTAAAGTAALAGHPGADDSPPLLPMAKRRHG